MSMPPPPSPSSADTRSIVDDLGDLYDLERDLLEV